MSSLHIDKCELEGKLEVPLGVSVLITNSILRGVTLYQVDPLVALIEEHAPKEK